MPAAAPEIATPDRERLARLGERLRDTRKRQKVSAVSAAEAAGISRVTLHRIEKGEPGVAMGAWIAAATVLGLELQAIDPRQVVKTIKLPKKIRLADYPQLRKLAWQLSVDALSPQDALSLYERNWRHVDTGKLAPDEAALIETLSKSLGGGRLLV